MLHFPGCKINIGLYITSRRQDGYHNIETVFYPLPVNDILEIIPASETKIHLSGLSVAGDSHDNLVWKAYQLLKQDFREQITPLDIHLYKAIPMGAGLGGGSSDGAAMLKLMNEYFKLKIGDEQLKVYALKLGSDCPFFIHETPCFASGRGELMEPIKLDLSGYSILLVCPDIHVSTAKAFAAMTPKPAPVDLRTLASLPVQQWKDTVANDFEGPIFNMYPQLAEIKAELYNSGSIYAAMSGSGSALYGLFEKGKRPDVSGWDAATRFIE